MAKCYFMGCKKVTFLQVPYFEFKFLGSDENLGSLDFYVLSKNKSLRCAKVRAKENLAKFSFCEHSHYFDWRK